MLTDNQIQAMVQNAFAPLRCSSEIFDYGYRLRFRVFNSNNEGIISFPELILDEIRDEKILISLINGERVRIKAKGFKLHPLVQSGGYHAETADPG